MKTKIYICILIAAFIALPAAQAGTKEDLMRLQSEVMAIQKQLGDFNRSYSETITGLHSLVIQLTDEIAKTNSALSRIGAALDSRTDDARNQDKTLLAEIRDLSEKIDDASISISVMAQQLNDFKSQAAMRGDGSAASGLADTIFNQAMIDHGHGDFDMAIDGFSAFLEIYPGGENAAKAWFYIGDSYYSQGDKPKQAVEAFTRVINNYPQSPFVPTALYKRARSEFVLEEHDNAIADYRDIIERFPTSTEAGQARSDLQLLESTQKPKTPAKTTPAKKTTGR